MTTEFKRLSAKVKRLKKANKFSQAAELLRRFVNVYPDNVEVLMTLGDLEMRLENFSSASKIYAFLVERFPSESTYLANLGGSLLRLGRISDARIILDRALEVDKKSLFARVNLGGVLQAQGDFQGALRNALEAVSIAPSNPLAFNNLGSAFSDLEMIAEARHAYETSVMLDSSQVDALINLGIIESRQGRHQSAVEHFERALAIVPPEQHARFDAIKFYACFCYFYLDQWEKAWDYYELGFSPLIPADGARSPRRVFPVPRWDGVIAPGKTLLIWREQGIGDEVLFASIFNDLRSSGMRIILECEPRLVELWRRSFPEFEVRAAVFNSGSMCPVLVDFDFHLPICSLGAYFRRTKESFPNFQSYMRPDPDLVTHWGRVVKKLSGDRLKVGVIWRSIKLIPARNRGYTLPSSWEGVLDRKDLCFFSLQYGVMKEEILEAEAKFSTKIHVFDDLNYKDDFDQVAALVSQMDLVISPDTTMFMVAGALNIPTICMMISPVGYYGCYDKFPFFPSVKILHTDNYEEEATDLLKKLPSALDDFLSTINKGAVSSFK